MDKDYTRLIKEVKFLKTAYRKADFLDDLPQIALAGRSNCGKSTLINAIINRKNFARVSSKPGYTKSINFILINNSFYLVDLPGFGYAKTSKKLRQIWDKIITDYFNYSKNLKCVLHLIDIRRIITEKDLELINFLDYLRIPEIIVFTKIDKLSKNELNNNLKIFKNKFPNFQYVLTSGLKKIGIYELWEKILDYLKK